MKNNATPQIGSLDVDCIGQELIALLRELRPFLRRFLRKRRTCCRLFPPSPCVCFAIAQPLISVEVTNNCRCSRPSPTAARPARVSQTVSAAVWA